MKIAGQGKKRKSDRQKQASPREKVPELGKSLAREKETTRSGVKKLEFERSGQRNEKGMS